MTDKQVIIIGAGIAGLAAGCYAQMNGYRSQIFELHDLPGGLCTAWERKDYVFDGCIHYLFGSGPGQPFHRIWQELGTVQGRRMLYHDELMRVMAPDGRTFVVYCDPDRLEAHIRDLSPPDAHLGKQLADGVRQMMRFDMSLMRQQPMSTLGVRSGLQLGWQMMPFAMPMLRWARLSAQDFANRFQDPLLRQAIPLVFGWPEIPMMAALSVLAYMQTRNAGFPAGGSLEFARAIERRYLALGGTIHYKSQVEKILVEGDRAVGVRLYNDDTVRADIVVSAADGRATIFEMLGGEYTNARIRRWYDGRQTIHSQVQVSLGVNRDLSQEPHWVTYLQPTPVTIAGEDRYDFGVKHYCFDASLAPAGKSVVEVMLRSSYGYWQRIYGHRLYDTEQSQVADQVIGQLDRLYPGLAAQVEVSDVATPLSYERYTGNWQGSTCGWLLTRQTMLQMITGMGYTLPRLAHFYLAGQWVEPGGMVPQAAVSGRNVVQLMCRADGRPFVTNVAD